MPGGGLHVDLDPQAAMLLPFKLQPPSGLCNFPPIFMQQLLRALCRFAMLSETAAFGAARMTSFPACMMLDCVASQSFLL